MTNATAAGALDADLALADIRKYGQALGLGEDRITKIMGAISRDDGPGLERALYSRGEMVGRLLTHITRAVIAADAGACMSALANGIVEPHVIPALCEMSLHADRQAAMAALIRSGRPPTGHGLAMAIQLQDPAAVRAYEGKPGGYLDAAVIFCRMSFFKQMVRATTQALEREGLAKAAVGRQLALSATARLDWTCLEWALRLMPPASTKSVMWQISADCWEALSPERAGSLAGWATPKQLDWLRDSAAQCNSPAADWMDAAAGRAMLANRLTRRGPRAP